MKTYYLIRNPFITKIIFCFNLILFLFFSTLVSAESFTEVIENSPDENECVADFVYYSGGSYDKPNGFQFINLSVGNIVSVVWDFGDGASSDQYSPEHEFPEAGAYNVCLTVYCADSMGVICCADSVCKSVVVDYNIGGHIFAGEFPIDKGRVWLYKIEEEIIPIDTTFFDTLGYYYFYQIPEGEYLIKTSPANNSIYFNTHCPVYYGDHISWVNAERINVYNNNFELNINLEPLALQAIGNGLIQGKASDYMTGLPLEDIEIMLTDLSYNPMKFTFSDQDGIFILSNLEYGTYYLTAEITGFNCNSLMITIDDDNPHIIDLDYLIDFNNAVGISDFNKRDSNPLNISIFPNPAQNEINIQFRIPDSEINTNTYKLLIRDINGNLFDEMNISTLNTDLRLDISGYASGIYSIVLQNNRRIFNRSKFVVIQ